MNTCIFFKVASLVNIRALKHVSVSQLICSIHFNTKDKNSSVLIYLNNNTIIKQKLKFYVEDEQTR
jgi:hypothetical protein